MSETCFDCRYWIADGLEPHEVPTEQRHWDDGCHQGRCVRHAPCVQPLRRDQHGDEFEPLARWPTTMAADWCGEFKPRFECEPQPSESDEPS